VDTKIGANNTTKAAKVMAAFCYYGFILSGVYAPKNMAKSIISQTSAARLPRAIAKEKDGIVLYWCEELQREGISQRGLSRLLECNPATIKNFFQGVNQVSIFEAEIITEGGIQGATLVDGEGVADLLLELVGSRAKLETRNLAKAISKRLAAAGFKLAVMLELAPQQLADQAQAAANKQERALPPAVSMHQYMVEIREWGLDSDPLIKSLITQRLAEELGGKALSSETITTQVILTVRAGELGYDHQVIGSGSQLGKFVSRIIHPVGKTQHGKYPVNVYELTPGLDDCIHAFFR
jgi:hypothetical protein